MDAGLCPLIQLLTDLVYYVSIWDLSVLCLGGHLMLNRNKFEQRKITFTEFSESCRSKFAAEISSKRDHEGNPLLDDPKVKQQLKLHKDALDKVGEP